MQEEKRNGEQTQISDTPSRAERILQERMEKRHRKASLGKILSYIISLIIVLLIIYMLKRGG